MVVVRVGDRRDRQVLFKGHRVFVRGEKSSVHDGYPTMCAGEAQTWETRGLTLSSFRDLAGVRKGHLL